MNTTPSSCTIHLAEEWTRGVDVGWDSLGLAWIAWLGSLGTGSSTLCFPGTIVPGAFRELCKDGALVLEKVASADQ
eukprot:2594695-Rhodomonas_salina.1